MRQSLRRSGIVSLWIGSALISASDPTCHHPGLDHPKGRSDKSRDAPSCHGTPHVDERMADGAMLYKNQHEKEVPLTQRFLGGFFKCIVADKVYRPGGQVAENGGQKPLVQPTQPFDFPYVV